MQTTEPQAQAMKNHHPALLVLLALVFGVMLAYCFSTIYQLEVRNVEHMHIDDAKDKQLLIDITILLLLLSASSWFVSMAFPAEVSRRMFWMLAVVNILSPIYHIAKGTQARYTLSLTAENSAQADAKLAQDLDRINQGNTETGKSAAALANSAAQVAPYSKHGAVVLNNAAASISNAAKLQTQSVANANQAHSLRKQQGITEVQMFGPSWWNREHDMTPWVMFISILIQELGWAIGSLGLGWCLKELLARRQAAINAAAVAATPPQTDANNVHHLPPAPRKQHAGHASPAALGIAALAAGGGAVAMMPLPTPTHAQNASQSRPPVTARAAGTSGFDASWLPHAVAPSGVLSHASSRAPKHDHAASATQPQVTPAALQSSSENQARQARLDAQPQAPQQARLDQPHTDTPSATASATPKRDRGVTGTNKRTTKRMTYLLTDAQIASVQADIDRGVNTGQGYIKTTFRVGNDTANKMLTELESLNMVERVQHQNRHVWRAKKGVKA